MRRNEIKNLRERGARGKGPDFMFRVTGVRGLHMPVGWAEISVLATVVMVQGV